jgi:hypothetical protein
MENWQSFAKRAMNNLRTSREIGTNAATEGKGGY